MNFLKFNENQILLEANFLNFDLAQNWGPSGPAVLTFIGYEQLDTQTDKQSIYLYIHRMLYLFSNIKYSKHADVLTQCGKFYIF